MFKPRFIKNCKPIRNCIVLSLNIINIFYKNMGIKAIIKNYYPNVRYDASVNPDLPLHLA